MPPTVAEKAVKNRDGDYVCRVCGSKTYDPNIAYCTESHARADGGTQVVSTAVHGPNNSDNPPDGSLSDRSQFLDDRRAEEMVRAKKEHATEAAAAGYVAVENGHVGDEVLQPATDGSDVEVATTSGLLVEADMQPVDSAVATEPEATDDRPAKSANKQPWVDYRLAHGYTEAELEGLSKDQVIELKDR